MQVPTDRSALSVNSSPYQCYLSTSTQQMERNSNKKQPLFVAMVTDAVTVTKVP